MARRETPAERDQRQADDERERVELLPQSPLCSMCVCVGVLETGDVCDGCFAAWNDKPRPAGERRNRPISGQLTGRRE